MSVDEKILREEKALLEKDFSTLKTKIEKFEQDLGQMRSNLNAIYGAIQQTDKLLKLVNGDKKNEKV
jgi:phage shock protein A